MRWYPEPSSVAGGEVMTSTLSRSRLADIYNNHEMTTGSLERSRSRRRRLVDSSFNHGVLKRTETTILSALACLPEELANVQIAPAFRPPHGYMLQATGIHVASKGIAARRTTLVPLLRSINYSYPARNNLVLAGQRRHASSTPDGNVLSDVGPALQEISASTAPSTSVLLLALFGLPLALWSYKVSSS